MENECKKKLKVLVIDDDHDHQQSARETLTEHDLTVCCTVEEAFEILTHNGHLVLRREGDRVRERLVYDIPWPYDAVLTDLWMPLPKRERSCFMGVNMVNAYEDGLGVIDHPAMAPVGAFFALQAVNLETPFVAIVTDTNHHDDRLACLTDMFNGYGDGPYFGEGSRLCRVYRFAKRSYHDGRGRKDWGKVLSALINRDSFSE